MTMTPVADGRRVGRWCRTVLGHADPHAHAHECKTCENAVAREDYREMFGEPLPTRVIPPRSNGTVRKGVQLRPPEWCGARGQWVWSVLDGVGRVIEVGEDPDRDRAGDAARNALSKATTVPVPRSASKTALRWAVAVTTCHDVAGRWAAEGWPSTEPVKRHLTHLPTTLRSIAAAGFPAPRLFVDGARTGFDGLGLEVTYRWPAVLTWGNWLLSFQELFVRTPDADRFAVFQDDALCCRGLRTYLDRCPYPDGTDGRPRGYLNLYTAKDYHVPGATGWRESPVGGTYPGGLKYQLGQGAVALVFDRAAALAVLSSPYATRKAADPRPDYRHKRADGGVVNAMNQAGWREYVHGPCLVQHTGVVSSMGNAPDVIAPDFPGEDFDATTLLGTL